MVGGLQWAFGLGAVVSLALVAGLGVWGYKLTVRDVSGVPVVRALEGPMRVLPTDPGGKLATHQGLAVNAVQADSGIEASARYRIRPNLVLEGALRQRLYGNCEGGAVSVSALPAVRRTNAQFRATDLIEVDYLTLTHHGRPAADLYSRVSAGYLERMYGGIPAELLRKSVASRLALGAEVNFVAQRDVDLGFGFQDDPALTNILTGHISSYYDFQNGVRRRWMWAAIWLVTMARLLPWIKNLETVGRLGPMPHSPMFRLMTLAKGRLTKACAFGSPSPPSSALRHAKLTQRLFNHCHAMVVHV